MKTTRKIFALLLCLAMVLGMATTAFAYDVELTGTLTAGHTYKVYQIFTGDLAKVGEDTVLSNIKYGSIYPVRTEGNTATGAFLGESVPEDVLQSITDARTFAAGLTLGTEYGVLNKGNNWTLENVPAGYYLIKDVTNMDDEKNEDLETNNSLSEFIVQVVDDVTMAPKADNLIPGKKINSDDHDDDFVDSDDYDGETEKPDDSVAASATSSNGGIGTIVKFDLTVEVPENADNYTYYYCVLNDTLSEGLTFNSDSMVVTIDGQPATEDVDYKYYTGADADPYTFQIAMLKANELDGKTIVATYTATINEDAIIGVEGNPNDFTVKYSNDPNHNYKPNPDKPGKPSETENPPVGETPVIETRTYVTALQVLKIDGKSKDILTGAEFKLEGTSIQKVIVTGVEYVAKTEFAEDETVYFKLLDGSYTDEEPRTADKYVPKAEDDRDGGYVKIGEGETDKDYRVATNEELEGNVKLYTKLLKNDHLYASTTTKYEQKEVNEVKEISENVTATAFVDENGIVRFTGLGEGVFTLTEITAPSGYNILEDEITITIDWTAPTEGTNCSWDVKADGKPLSAVEVKIEGEGEDAESKTIHVYQIEVKNEKGSVLPETGGIGTTLFYVFGSVMVLAAVILLVTKKRMNMAN